MTANGLKCILASCGLFIAVLSGCDQKPPAPAAPSIETVLSTCKIAPAGVPAAPWDWAGIPKPSQSQSIDDVLPALPVKQYNAGVKSNIPRSELLASAYKDLAIAANAGPGTCKFIAEGAIECKGATVNSVALSGWASQISNLLAAGEMKWTSEQARQASDGLLVLGHYLYQAPSVHDARRHQIVMLSTLWSAAIEIRKWSFEKDGDAARTKEWGDFAKEFENVIRELLRKHHESAG